MDDASRSKFEQEMDSFRDSVYESGLDTDTKNCFMTAIALMQRMHEDTQMAHLRIDHRKDELKTIKKNLEALTEKIGEMADKINDLTDSQKMLIKMFNTQVQRQIEQMEQQKRYGKRMAIYISAISVLSLIGTFGSIKGASIAASIWSVVSKLL